MPKDHLTLNDIEMVKKIVRDEIKDLVDISDEVSAQNFNQMATRVNMLIDNINKLQAQVTAIKDALTSKGLVARDTLISRENEALEKLNRASRGEKQAQGAHAGRA